MKLTYNIWKATS